MSTDCSPPAATLGRLCVAGVDRRVIDIVAFASHAGIDLRLLPFSARVLLEMLLRHGDQDAAQSLSSAYSRGETPPTEFRLRPTRLLLQDYTGVPLIVDLAALRAELQRTGVDPQTLQPVVPVDLVVDHSVHADASGPNARETNEREERRKNAERFEFLSWAARAFSNLRVIPSGNGIVHQVNLERLAMVVTGLRHAGGAILAPELVIGTDSHTTMTGGVGILGWGVGGLEAEGMMLGFPVGMRAPPIVGINVRGRLRPHVNATDAALTLTALLRDRGALGAIVEFTGPGLITLSGAERCTLANMAPEYGATTAYFPIDVRTLEFLARNGRPTRHVAMVEDYARQQMLFREPADSGPRFAEFVEFKLDEVDRCVAGPSQPHQRLSVRAVRASFDARHPDRPAVGAAGGLERGAIVLAAIASCTNTSNPAVMIAAGLLAQRAVARGLSVPAHVKTSFTPGSPRVTEYLKDAGLLHSLEALGFHVAAYGCASCNGGSGALKPGVLEAIRSQHLEVATVLSGNRNFERRIHLDVAANYLASPPLVVALALAGNILVNLERDPVGTDREGKPVYLAELWPETDDIDRVAATVPPLPEQVGEAAAASALPTTASPFTWRSESTYIRSPPYFVRTDPARISDARALLVLGDNVSTDQISPVGEIPADSPAGQYLRERGVSRSDFNTYGARRGNHEVMARGTFSSRAIVNVLAPELLGGHTVHLPSGRTMTVHAAAEAYSADGTPLIVFAGKNYGVGSSRDWAAKGPWLLGVCAIIAESFERIHRANLVAMGILPVEIGPGALTRAGIDLRGRLTVSAPAGVRSKVELTASTPEGSGRVIATARIDTEAELAVYRRGGMMPYLIDNLTRTGPLQIASPPSAVEIV